MSRKKIIFLSEKNPESKRDWSGIPYFMFQALRQIYEVECLSGPRLTVVRKVLYYAGKILQKLSGAKFVFDYGRVPAWFYGRYYNRHLGKRTDVKFIFVPAGLTEISALKTAFPLVAVGDCSTLQLFDYYPAMENVAKISWADVERVERTALARCSRVIFSSHWASDFVKAHYGVECATIPFGANIRLQNRFVRNLDTGACRLLLVGVDWKRKGAETALAVHRSLIANKMRSSLTVVGMRPDIKLDLPPEVQFTFVNKDSETGELAYIELLRNSDFLILPTLADCTPIVIAEAFAAGLPVLATRTGGIPSMIEEGVTGFLFEPGDAKGYIDRIMQLSGSPQIYEKISSNCLEASQTKFNWHRWAAELEKLCASL